MARAPKGKKARKAAPVKARVKKRSMARLQAIAPDTGPVTLEEARALARAKRPTLAFQDVGKTAAPPASPAVVGAARQKLKKEQRDERARRIREYKATMEIMKRRGARRPAAERPQGGRRRTNGGRRGIVRPAADLRRGGFLVRLSGPVFRRQYHPAPRAPARRPDPQSGESR